MTGFTPRRLRRLTAGVVAATGLLVCVSAGGALGALRARVDNTGNSAASATMLYSHSYGASCTNVPTSGGVTDAVQTTACPGSPYPATIGARTDAITANGTIPAARVAESVAISSCGVVALANERSSANPLLPRYGTSFGVAGPFTGAIALDGAAPGGYATAAAAETAQGMSVLGASWGAGIWFKNPTTSAGGPLFSLGTSAARDTAESLDRTLFLTAAGNLGFVYRTSGATVTSAATFKDNIWHFAYARITTAVTGITVTIGVDGTQVATQSVLLSGLDALTGYWHLGWAPVVSTNPTQFFGGALAGFAVFNSGAAPAAPAAKPATQAAMDTFAATATGYWKLLDSGTTTVPSGTTLPTIGTNAPCGYVDIQWGSLNPTSCAVTPTSTTAACTGSVALPAAGITAKTIGTVAPGTTQNLTLTLSRDSASTTAITTYVAGLIAYAPVTIKFAATATWFATFTWTAVGTGFLL